MSPYLLEFSDRLFAECLSEFLEFEGCLACTGGSGLVAFCSLGEVIAAALPVAVEYMSREEAASIVDLSKLPEDVSETLRIVRIGDYDDCACIGAHVCNTSEIGEFRIISHDFNDGVWRVRWKVIAKQ